MNIHSSREREEYSGALVPMFAAVCFFCHDYRLEAVSTKGAAVKALRAADWHTTQGRWYCGACYRRHQGYKELEKREHAHHSA